MNARCFARVTLAARMAASVAVLLSLGGRASAGDESFARLWQSLQHKTDAERADALEAYLGEWPEARDRKAAIKALASLSSAPALSSQEWWDLEALSHANAGCEEVLAGRHVLVLATHAFAENARRADLICRLDLVYAGLHALFGTDPVAARRHRVYVFPDPTMSSVLQINRDALRIRVPWERRDDANMLDSLCHELAHAFVGDHPAWHLYAEGFFEGWGDFAPVFCSDWLGTVGEQDATHARELMASVRNAGEVEYLPTRLAIEDAVGYAPAGALFAELTLASSDDGGAFDWDPWRRLFRERSFLPAASTASWPARLARELEWAFGAERARPVLRRWRFPPNDVALATAEDVPALVPSATGMRERWATRGERVLGNWRVLGPIPDAKHWLLEFDPLDGASLTATGPCELDGTKYAWRDGVETDDYGTLRLDSIAGSGVPANWYLVREFAADETPPAEIALTSDDCAIAWLDGVEILRVSRARRVDVFDASRVLGTTRPGPHRLVVLVADEGGRNWVNVRASAKSALTAAWNAEINATDTARRAAACACIGTRIELRETAVALLSTALNDTAAEVRRAAALALGGRRNDFDALDALWRRKQREKDAGVKTAVESSLRELLLLPHDSPIEYERMSRDYAARWWFVECERTVRDGRAIGGFYGAPNEAYGRQSLGREWGGDDKSWFAVTLACRAAGTRTLRVRYVQPDADDARVTVELRRGSRRVWGTDLHLSRTDSWVDWRWAELETPALEPGTYQLHVMSTSASASPDFDVIGWR